MPFKTDISTGWVAAAGVAIGTLTWFFLLGRKVGALEAEVSAMRKEIAGMGTDIREMRDVLMKGKIS